jgi:hypothetical protein
MQNFPLNFPLKHSFLLILPLVDLIKYFLRPSGPNHEVPIPQALLLTHPVTSCSASNSRYRLCFLVLPL